MLEVNIYSFDSSLFAKIFPKLVESVHSAGILVQILCNNEELLELDNLLWTYSTLAFLPHCTENDDCNIHKNSPVFLTTNVSNNPNNAKTLICVNMGIDYIKQNLISTLNEDNGAENDKAYKKVLLIFSNTDAAYSPQDIAKQFVSIPCLVYFVKYEKDNGWCKTILNHLE